MNKCVNCGKEYDVPAYAPIEQRLYYCSFECMAEYINKSEYTKEESDRFCDKMVELDVATRYGKG